MHKGFEQYLCSVTESEACDRMEVIQSLWSGYGEICRYNLKGSHLKTVVVKHISWPKGQNHPRGWNTQISHQRKLRSYQVETNWYQHWSSMCDDDCYVPTLIGTYIDGDEQWIVLEDLDVHFPIRKEVLEIAEVKQCLTWLANFHGRFIMTTPKGLWPIGTYWHLETRPEEYEKMAESELKAKAHDINRILNECTYMTIVHGDAKVANFCFDATGHRVAAVDFQYVGGGCGMKDVAYLFGSCLSGDACELHEATLLDFYFQKLKHALKQTNTTIQFDVLEEEWRRLYPLVCADFVRFLLGWMPNHRKLNAYNMKMVDVALHQFRHD